MQGLPGGRGWEVAGPAAVLTMALGLIGGCSTPPQPRTDITHRWTYTAETDSLGLDEFLALSRSDQERRRDLAAQQRRLAASRSGLYDRILDLVNAAGLAPDQPDTWLDLAERGRWVGDYVQTVQWLDNAAAAVRSMPDDETAHWFAARRTALLRGWLHFDRADWREGLAWANTLYEREKGDKGIALLRGLLGAGAGNRSIAERMADYLERQDPFDPDVRWILATLERAQHRPDQALNYMLDLRPELEHASEYFRTAGEVAEFMAEYSHASRYYRESAHALPIDDRSVLQQRSGERLDGPGFQQSLEFWTAFDRYYVTGSLSAYTRWAWNRYQDATDPEEKVFWAGQAVNGAGILIRKEMDRPWAQRVRGLIFLETDELEKALTDLRSASRRLGAADLQDARIEAGLGHGLLLKERYHAALQPLRKAVELDPGDATAWSDLGLALVMTDDPHGAEQALDRAVVLDPEAPTAWYNRGLLHLRGGNFAQAYSDLEEAARLAPNHPGVVQLLQKARGLQLEQERRNQRRTPTRGEDE